MSISAKPLPTQTYALEFKVTNRYTALLLLASTKKKYTTRFSDSFSMKAVLNPYHPRVQVVSNRFEDLVEAEALLDEASLLA